MSDITKQKCEWVTTKTWKKLHHVPQFVGEDGGWKESFIGEGKNKGVAACGLKGRFIAPGFISRMHRPRCNKCCKKVGITPGVGCPVNDKTVKRISDVSTFKIRIK